MKKGHIFITIAFLFAACTHEKPQEKISQVDAYLKQLEQNREFSGAVLIAKDGNILLSKGYGMADMENQIPNTSQTRYPVSWLTASFTAMSIMQLQADGKLDVGDPICDYIPDCPDYWDGITIHHLLTHTSGVADEIKPWESEAEKPKNGLERVGLIKGKAPYFSPGEKLQCSTNGYVILGAIIEEVSGQPYAFFVKENVLEPLGMHNSDFEGNNIATGYKLPDTKLPEPDMFFRYSAGGLFSTTEDLYLWDQAHYGEKLVQQKYLELIFTGYALTPSVDFEGAEYGYGWFIGNNLDQRVIFHGGGVGGYFAMILRFPDERETIIVLRNNELQIYDRLEIELARMAFSEERSTE